MSVANVGYPVIVPQFPPGVVVQLNALTSSLTTRLVTDSGNQGTVLTNNQYVGIPNTNVPVGSGLACISGTVTVPDNTTPMEYIEINSDNQSGLPAYNNYAYTFPYQLSDTRFAFNVTVPFLNNSPNATLLYFKSVSFGAADSTIQDFQVVYTNFGIGPT